MSDELDRIEAELKDLEERAAKIAETAYEAVINDFLAKFPEVHALTWTQGTPSFNDGDPCRFGVDEVEVIPTISGWEALGLGEPAGEVEDIDEETETVSGYDLYDYGPDREHKFHNERAKELFEALERINSFFSRPTLTDYLEDEYTEYGARVKVTRTGTTSEEYYME